MRAIVAVLLLLLPMLLGCSELQFEKDRGSGSSGDDGPVGNVLVTVDFTGFLGSIITSVEIQITRVSGDVETSRPPITYPFSADVWVDPGDLLHAEAAIVTNTAIGRMQLRDNPAVVANPITYETDSCGPGTCTLITDRQF